MHACCAELTAKVNGHRLGKGKRRVLVHGDEVSLGHASTIETQVTDDGKVIEGHDVRYIFRSVGRKGAHLQDGDIAGEVYENYQMLES